jgi:hypothetical protein
MACRRHNTYSTGVSTSFACAALLLAASSGRAQFEVADASADTQLAISISGCDAQTPSMQRWLERLRMELRETQYPVVRHWTEAIGVEEGTNRVQVSVAPTQCDFDAGEVGVRIQLADRVHEQTYTADDLGDPPRERMLAVVVTELVRNALRASPAVTPSPIEAAAPEQAASQRTAAPAAPEAESDDALHEPLLELAVGLGLGIGKTWSRRDERLNSTVAGLAGFQVAWMLDPPAWLAARIRGTLAGFDELQWIGVGYGRRLAMLGSTRHGLHPGIEVGAAFGRVREVQACVLGSCGPETEFSPAVGAEIGGELTYRVFGVVLGLAPRLLWLQAIGYKPAGAIFVFGAELRLGATILSSGRWDSASSQQTAPARSQ